ncbi:MCE family protein [Mycolicibacterium sp. HS_4_1]
MKDSIRSALVQVGVLVTASGLAIFAVLAVFAQIRFDEDKTYEADFTNASGLKAGDFVRIAGVEVGKVQNISLRPDATVRVAFNIDQSVPLTLSTTAAIRWTNVIGDRYLELKQGASDFGRLNPGTPIPTSRTEPALDLDALIGGFRPLFRALAPDQVNALTGQLITAFQGQAGTISSFLTQTSAFTSTLADRDVLIGQVISNLNVVLGSLGSQSQQLGTTIDSLSQLIEGLAAHKETIAGAIAHINTASATVADLLIDARAPLQRTVAQSDRVTSTLLAQHEYLEKLIDSLPEKYRALSRQGLYGDFFMYYLCDLILKVNGKDGQPVYVKIAGQSSGRCTPK